MHSLKIASVLVLSFAAGAGSLMSRPPAVAAKPPRAATVAVRQKAISHPEAKRHRATVQVATFVGDQPVVELASDNTYGHVTEAIDNYIKETADVPNATLEMTPTVTLARPDLISVYYKRTIDTGGAHPAGDYLTFSYGIVNGIASALKLSNLFAPGVDADTAVVSAVRKQLQAKGIPITMETGGTTPPLTRKSVKNWVLTPTGVTFLFAAGEINTYADGDLKVHCRWRDLESAAGTGKLSPLVKPLR